MTRVVAVLVACMALATWASVPQAAAGKGVGTRLEDRGLDILPGHDFARLSIHAQIDSKERACKVRRRAKLFFELLDERTLKDTGRSSRRGAVGLAGRASVVPDLVILRVQKKRIQRHGRRFTCSPDSLRWRPRAPTLSFTFDPDTVPEGEFEAGALHVHVRTGITHDALAKRIELDFDDHFRFSPGAFPTCDPQDIFANSDQNPPDMTDAMAQCGSALVGTGTGQAGEPTYPVFNACVLVFNGTQSDDGLPTLLLFVRAQASPPVIDCSDPESNHAGNYTLLLQGSLGHEVPGSGYGRTLNFENMQSVPLPILGLDLTLGRDRFVTARCGADDALRGWQMRAQLSYVKPHSEQSASFLRRCVTG
ncbi:MAG: hypothetical protein ACRDK1_10995 [Solirubrobacterales bacterium]